MVSEKYGDNRQELKAGLYRHRESGAELVAIETSKFGNPQADAYARLGYVYVGPAPKQATENYVDPHAAPATTPMGVKSAAELRVELAEAEKREANMAEQRKANEQNEEKTEVKADAKTDSKAPVKENK